ncbi:MAG: hypothetical protein QW703_00530 [Candidatus Aenigmatarchaeota archaeon]
MKGNELPITSPEAIICGWIAGSFIAAAFLGWYGFIFQILLFLLGLFIFLDHIFPFGKPLYSATILICFVLGVIFYYALLVFKIDIPYLFICLLAFAYFYHKKIQRKPKHHK